MKDGEEKKERVKEMLQVKMEVKITTDVFFDIVRPPPL